MLDSDPDTGSQGRSKEIRIRNKVALRHSLELPICVSDPDSLNPDPDPDNMHSLGCLDPYPDP
jgi:hypothetical protein